MVKQCPILPTNMGVLDVDNWSLRDRPNACYLFRDLSTLFTIDRTMKNSIRPTIAVGAATTSKKPFLQFVSGAQSPRASAIIRKKNSGAQMSATTMPPHLLPAVVPPRYSLSLTFGS
jgi:hypothetical protein